MVSGGISVCRGGYECVSDGWERELFKKQKRRKERERDLATRLELARVDPQQYLRMYGCPYYGRF